MKKIYLVKTGEEIKFGDTVACLESLTHPVFGEVVAEVDILVTPETLSMLQEIGAVVVKGEDKKSITLTIDDVINRLAAKAGWKPEKMCGYLTQLVNINASAWLNVLIREIAIALDEQYPDHINNCEEVWVLSTMTGKLTKIHRKQIKTFRNFAAFRTLEDAKFACRMLKPALKEMFGDN